MINLRIFVPAENIQEATALENQFRKRLIDIADIHTQTHSLYQKIPRLYDHTDDLHVD